jgi:ketosteroid isomerase-like protein
MTEHANVQRIRDNYTALVAGDVATALKDLAPNGVFHFTGSGPLSGDRTGVAEISETLIGLAVLTEGTLQLDIRVVFADGQHGVVALRERASRPDGATLDVEEVHVLSFDGEGRITDIWDLPDDPEAHIRFFDGQ